MIGQIEKEGMMVINKEVRDDILVIWLWTDKYYVYRLKFKWHEGAENWALSNVDMVAVLNHHVGLCSEMKVNG